MGNRRFSVTTYVLVGISLFALYYVGKTVTPPPPVAPPEPRAAPGATPGPAKPNPAAAAEMKAHQEEEARRAKMRTDKMAEMMKAQKDHPMPNVKAFNPTTTDTDSDYWQKYKMGQQGSKEMREKVAKALAEQKQHPDVPVKQRPSPVMPGP